MKRLGIKYVLFFFVIFTISVKAQDTLSISSNWLKNRVQDTLSAINPPQSLKLSYSITGNSSAPVTASIKYEFYIKNSYVPNGSLFYVDTTSMQNRTFVAGEIDSIDIVPSVDQNQSNFRTGINGIVIWPRSDNPSAIRTIDSLEENIYIILPQIGPTKDTSISYVFPNPFVDRIDVVLLGLEVLPERVRIIDLNGQVVFDADYKQSLYINYLSVGKYIMQCYSGTKILKQFPLVKF